MRIGRRLRTQEIDVGGYNIREEFLRWLYFPVKNPMEKYNFLTPTEERKYIDSNHTALDDLLEMLPDSRRNAEEITCLAEEKVLYSSYAFAASKARATFSCDVFYAPHCIYSKKAIGEPNGPRNLQACLLDQWTESVYVF